MPHVNPQILVWARESAGFDLSTASHKLSFTDSKTSSAEQKLQAYEKGEQPPSRALLIKMAKQYRRPLLTFYLNEPPRHGNRGEDFRTLTHDVDPSQNALVDALVRNVQARQEIVKDALISAKDREALAFVGSYDIRAGTQSLVEQIQKSFGFDQKKYRSFRTQDDAFKYLRACVEGAGVFTLLLGNLGSHHTNLSTEVFRGFALSDDIAPFIVINDQDAKLAWSVTLLHEVAHLWLGKTGISGGSIERTLEKFCNEVASEILLPEIELENRFNYVALQGRESAINAIDSFASNWKVSSRLVAFRLFRRKAIDQQQFNELSKIFYERWSAQREKQKAKDRSGNGGPSYYVLKRNRLGAALIDTSERLLRSGELSTTRVATVLGVRALKIEKLFNETQLV
ncbi:MAG: ImmA/IrrE family metallo-endopeptidase [Candidatus Competibacteraceae bacterium]|nr:ImmA/IrrE family metallo-endopeptidase [Candidatus Competibacteraceae bacterium]